jgi:hypothetical protein
MLTTSTTNSGYYINEAVVFTVTGTNPVTTLVGIFYGDMPSTLYPANNTQATYSHIYTS